MTPRAQSKSQFAGSMFTTLTTLIERLDSVAVSGTAVIPWGCPVPSFGDLGSSEVATLGLNPSNREFVDEQGQELEGSSRRFHTLQSLGLEAWSDADVRDLSLILESCRSYFLHNPYDRWFRRLNHITSAVGASFYGKSRTACHLDLIPYATSRKWTELAPAQRSKLLRVAGDTLALLLRDSPVRVLILNGRSVVEHFQSVAGLSLENQPMPTWSLPRQSVPDVAGVAYRGVIDTLSGIPLGREILVLGYNHNLQSSFGVTTIVMDEIRDWVGLASSDALQ
jgi:hypothetical protein